MNFYSSNSFNQLYFNMLQNAFYSPKKFSDSRTGKVKDLGRTVYQIKNDTFRLCFLKERDINPFFAFAEFSWILEGSNKLKPLEYFISTYSRFSDDGKTLNGAYGFRLRKFFHFDQINKAIEILKNDSNSRRVVLTMFSPHDLTINSKDIPCNTTIYLKIRNKKFDITILNRSNDLYLGVPYNVFVFYLLQVYIAKSINCEIGIQTHYTDSLHLYEKHLSNVENIIKYNSLDKIIQIEKSYDFVDNGDYINIDHNNVIKHTFSSMNESIYKELFILFSNYKINKKVSLDIMPNNLLEYMIYNWFNKRQAIENPQKNKLEYEGINMTTTDIGILKNLKYKKPEKAIEQLNIISQKYLSKINDFKALIQDNNQNSIFKMDITDNKKFLYLMSLVVVIESMSSEIYDRELREKLMQNIREICNELDINLDDVFYFSKYENEIINIFTQQNLAPNR